MKTKKHICSSIMILVGVLELMPYGAVLNFGRSPEEGGVWRETYSYFDLTPFGYANFGPFLTAVISLLIMLAMLISLFTKRQKLWGVVRVLSPVGVITSLMPLMLGLDYYTVIGLAITILFVVQLVLCLTMKNYQCITIREIK